MEFKYSLSMLFSNMGYAVKIFLWILICLLITVAIGAAIVLPVWDAISAVTDVSTHINALEECIKSVWDGTNSMRAAFTQGMSEVQHIFADLGSNAGIATGLAFIGVFLYAFYCFLFGLSYYALADIINNIMASNLKFGFASNLALNFKKCVKYSLCRLVIALPIDLIFFMIMACIIFGLFRFIGLFVLPIALVVGVVICSLRATLFAGWLPRLLFHPEERVFTAFTRSLTYVKSNVSGLFKSYAITFSFVYLFSTTFAIPTGGLMSIVLPSLYYFILRAIELIGYYKTKGYSFYTDATTVINTVEFGYRAEQQDKDGENFDESIENAVEVENNDGDTAQESVADVESVYTDTDEESATQGIDEVSPANNQDGNLDE